MTAAYDDRPFSQPAGPDPCPRRGAVAAVCEAVQTTLLASLAAERAEEEARARQRRLDATRERTATMRRPA